MTEVPSAIPSRGRPKAALLLEVVRELTPADLSRLSDAPKVGVPVLQKLRAIHHRQAQLLASGRTPTEVAAIVGCTVQRLVQLQIDPSFQQLMHYYQDQVMVQALEDGARLKDKLVDLGEMAVDELRERLEDDQRRKNTHIGEIRKIAEFAMDRTVAPPKTAVPPNSTPATITINFGTKLRPPSPTPTTIEGSALPQGFGQGQVSTAAVPLTAGRSDLSDNTLPQDVPLTAGSFHLSEGPSPSAVPPTAGKVSATSVPLPKSDSAEGAAERPRLTSAEPDLSDLGNDPNLGNQSDLLD